MKKKLGHAGNPTQSNPRQWTTKTRKNNQSIKVVRSKVQLYAQPCFGSWWHPVNTPSILLLYQVSAEVVGRCLFQLWGQLTTCVHTGRSSGTMAFPSITNNTLRYNIIWFSLRRLRCNTPSKCTISKSGSRTFLIRSLHVGFIGKSVASTSKWQCSDRR